MRRRELQLLNPVASGVIDSNRGIWATLKYETQFGPEFHSFPYYPAAAELNRESKAAVKALSIDARHELVHLWKGSRRLIDLETEDEILTRYGMVVLDLIVQRARRAGSRTSNW
jgi:hypothetical protein